MLDRVVVGGEFSESFPVTNGVRQGCIAGPKLFNIFYAAMLSEATRDLRCGIYIQFSSFRKIVQCEQAESIEEQSLRADILWTSICRWLRTGKHTSLQDIHLITNRFAKAAKKYGLVINIQKTEVMFQPAPGNTYNDPIVTVDSVPLKPVKEFCYLGSIVTNDALIDKEIANRISGASASFGRLHSRVWNERGIQLHTKLKVYKAVVLTNLLYGCKTWTCYRRHIKALDKFHIRHLRILLKIKRQDRIPNAEVLERSQSTRIDAMLIAAQMRWAGHVWRMGDERISKQLPVRRTAGRTTSSRGS